MLLRHQLVYLHDKAHFTLIPTPNLPANASETVTNWLAKGWPCIMANQFDTAPTDIRLGLMLYQSGHCYRLSLLVDRAAMSKTRALPMLNQVVGELSHDKDESTGVYGSFMWQHMTHQPYIHEHSDIDILINQDNISISWLKDRLVTLQKTLKRNIDGEVRFHELGDINIKELCQNSPSLLVKSTTKATLIGRKQLYEYYPNLCK